MRGLVVALIVVNAEWKTALSHGRARTANLRLEEARGHGVYRALIAKRWELAVERGTPALTVQAGRMSRPILERVGFQFVAPVKIYADAFTGE